VEALLDVDAAVAAAALAPSPLLVAVDVDGTLSPLAPRADLAWLASARHLQPVDDLPVWSVPCFFVRRSHRQRGVMAALVDAAVDAARHGGAPALEAYPVDTGVPGHTTNLFPGVASVFAERGFTVVARRRDDRPVMRRVL
jgi:GNAT superfamily N-acetyltransferase